MPFLMLPESYGKNRNIQIVYVILICNAKQSIYTTLIICILRNGFWNYQLYFELKSRLHKVVHHFLLLAVLHLQLHEKRGVKRGNCEILSMAKTISTLCEKIQSKKRAAYSFFNRRTGS